MDNRGNNRAARSGYLIYNRKSTDDTENQKNSLSYQRAENLKYAAREKLAVADLTMPNFCEDGVVEESHSGFKTNDEFTVSASGLVQTKIDRPKFLRLIRMLKNRELKGAIFLCWDRASRNEQDDVILKKLIKQGCDIRFAQTQYDNSSSGQLHQDIDGTFAAHYSRVISEKVRLSGERLRSEGRCLYLSPIGYLDNGSADKPLDPARAPIVKRIFELYSSGEWSMSQLAKWAQQQGLTTKPCRRKRTEEEILSNTPLESIPKQPGPVSIKSIEKILSNPFYVGKLRTKEGTLIDSRSHQPLIDSYLYHKVQDVLRARNVSVRYVDKKFSIYRAMVRCSCGRGYCPYRQKGFMYYRTRCNPECNNPDKNLTESEIHTVVQSVIDQVYFSDDEVREIEAKAHKALDHLATQRAKEHEDLGALRNQVLADLDYLKKNRITLLRTNMMDMPSLKAEEDKLTSQLLHIDQKSAETNEVTAAMLRYVINFSELIKRASLHYKFALDMEKREIVLSMFTELVFKDRKLEKFTLNEGCEALFRRTVSSGAPDYIFSELHRMYPLIKQSFEKMSALKFLRHSEQGSPVGRLDDSGD